MVIDKTFLNALNEVKSKVGSAEYKQEATVRAEKRERHYDDLSARRQPSREQLMVRCSL